MDLLKSILKRAAWGLLVLFGLTVIIYFLIKVVPGDQARLVLGANATQEVLEQYREANHLNDPIVVQYIYWLKSALSGNLGVSTITKRAVTTDLAQFLPATLELIFWAGIPPIFVSLLLGVVSARNKNRWPDYLIRFTGYIFVATPTFVIAVMCILIFGYILPVMPSIGGRISPQFSIPGTTGFLLIDAVLAGRFDALGDIFLHLLFPAISLCLGHVMQEARITRASMLQNSEKDYIIMAKSQGIDAGVINRKYLLKPSVIPSITVMGMDFAAMFGNAFLIERIFNWPGISSYGMTAILNKDTNAVCGVVLIIGMAFILSNIIVDIVGMILDPRMRQKRTR